jgi:AcrR family transcriptional regulator
MKRDKPSHSAAQAETAARRRPQQARALARVERILAAATELIAEKGSDQVTLSELAARAEITLGSLYQYFPDKSAIIRRLAETALERVQAALQTALAGIATPAEALARIDSVLDGYYALFLAEPVMRDIWCGAQADKTLQERDIDDSRRNGELAFAALSRFVPAARHPDFATACFLMMQLTGAAIRMAVAVERAEGDRLVEAYRLLIRAALADYLAA